MLAAAITAAAVAAARQRYSRAAAALQSKACAGMAELQALQDAVQAHGHQVSALKDKLEALRRRLPPTPKPPSGEHAPAAPALPALSAAEKLVALEHRTQLQAGQQQQPPTPPAAERPAAAQQQNQEQEPAVLPRRLRRHRKNWRQLPGGLEGVLVHESPGLTVVKVGMLVMGAGGDQA